MDLVALRRARLDRLGRVEQQRQDRLPQIGAAAHHLRHGLAVGDHARLPGRFFGRLTASIQAKL